MPSLAQLLTDHGTLLILDAASTFSQVGLLRPGLAPLWHQAAGESGIEIFRGVKTVTQSSALGLEQIEAFVFCEGPGSILGIRTVAMAIRTWQVLKNRPAYSYQSLAVAGGYAWTGTPRELAVVADARRDTWHLQITAADGRPGPPERRATADLPDGELLTPGNFRAWSSPARNLTTCSYNLAALFPAIAHGDYFRAVASPD